MVALPVVDALDAVTIPVSCPVSWDAMRGDDRTRFCGQCKQNVHDVSELTRTEAVRLVSGGEPACLRLYRRQDGRVMTADCTTRRERAWKWLHRRAPWAATAFTAVFMSGCGLWPPACVMGGIPMPPHVPPPDDAVGSVVGGAAVEAAKAQDESGR